MRKVKRKAARILAFVLSVATVLTTISFPMKAEAATPTTVKIKSAADVNKYLTADKYLLGLLGVSGSSSGVSYPGTKNAEVSAEWRVGAAYDTSTDDGTHGGESNVYSVSIATKYLYNRATKTPGPDTQRYETGYEADGSIKGTVYPETSKILGKKFVIDESLLTKGYHRYNEELPIGTQIPVKCWSPAGNSGTIHQEGHNVVTQNLGTTAYKMLSDGRWAMYHGFEFHAGDHYDDVKAVYNGPFLESSCGMRDAMRIERWNYTFWYAFCDICGDPINAVYVSGYHHMDSNLGIINDYKSLFNLYAPRKAVENLPVLEVGREFVLFCPYCGGLEANWYIEHKCKSISPNMYFLKYDKNAPDAQGFMATSSWLTNFENKYNGMEVPVSGNRTVSQNKFFREGYAFKGWSLTPDGAVDPTLKIADLSRFQTDPVTGAYYEDGHVTTLYAVWGPEENTLSVDTFTKNTVPNTHGTGTQPVWNTGYTGNGTAVYSNSNKVASWTLQYSGSEQRKDVLLNTGSIAYPSGSYVYFSPTERGTGLTGVLAVTNGYASDLKDDGGKKYKVGDVYVSGYTTGGALQGEISHTSDVNGATTALNYKYGQKTGGYEDIIYVLFDQKGIILPDIAAPTGKTFIGWYTASDAYVGMPGDYYPSPKSGDVTLYPKFNEFKVEVVDIYYKNTSAATPDEFYNRAENGKISYRGGIGESTFVPGGILNVRHAVGAINLKMRQFSAPGTTTVYKAYWAETKADVENDSASSNRKQFDMNGTDGMSVPEAVDLSFPYIDTNLDDSGHSVYVYEVPSAGIYDVTVAGAGGVNYVESGTLVHEGGAGDVITKRIFLNKGDVLRYAIGRVGAGSTGLNADSTPNGLNGGDRSYVHLIAAGSNDWIPLIVAGGGGSASKASNGGNGGETDPSHLLTEGYMGENGAAGGGAGADTQHGGKAGIDGGLDAGGYYLAFINAVDGNKSLVYEMTDETYSVAKALTGSTVKALSTFRYTHSADGYPTYAQNGTAPHHACNSSCVTNGVMVNTPASTVDGWTRVSHTVNQWDLVYSGAENSINSLYFSNSFEIGGDSAGGFYDIPEEARKDGKLSITLRWGDSYNNKLFKESDMISHTVLTAVNEKGQVIYSNYIGAGDQYSRFAAYAGTGNYITSYMHVLDNGASYPCAGYQAYINKGAACAALLGNGGAELSVPNFCTSFQSKYGISIGRNSNYWTECPFCALQSKTGVHTMNISGSQKIKFFLTTNEKPTYVVSNNTYNIDNVTYGNQRHQRIPNTFWYDIGTTTLMYKTGQLNFRAYYLAPNEVNPATNSGIFETYEDGNGNVHTVGSNQGYSARATVVRSHAYHTSASGGTLHAGCFGCWPGEGTRMFSAGTAEYPDQYAVTIGFANNRYRLLWGFDEFRNDAATNGYTVLNIPESKSRGYFNDTVTIGGNVQKRYFGGYINATQEMVVDGNATLRNRNAAVSEGDAWYWAGLTDAGGNFCEGTAIWTFDEELVIGEGNDLAFTRISDAGDAVLKLDFTYSHYNGSAYNGTNGVQAIGHFVVTVIDTDTGNVIYSNYLNKHKYTTQDGCLIYQSYMPNGTLWRQWLSAVGGTRVKFRHEDGTWCGDNCAICLNTNPHVVHEVNLGSTKNFRIFLTANEQSIGPDCPVNAADGQYNGGTFSTEGYTAHMPAGYTIKVNGIYQEYKVPDPKFAIAAPAYGGSSFINNDASLLASHPSLTSYHSAELMSKHGYGIIRSIEIGLTDSLDNNTNILGAKMPDKKAPVITDYEVNTSTHSVTWKTPENDQQNDEFGSEYWFIAERYIAKVVGSSIALERVQVSDPISKLLVSAIAGYYWAQDNNPGSSTMIADIVGDANSYKANSYTWTDSHYSGTYAGLAGKSYGMNFTQSTNITYSQEAVNAGDVYIHIAPVDVAGNVGPTITVSGSPSVQVSGYAEPVGIITFNSNAMQYHITPSSFVSYDGADGFRQSTVYLKGNGSNPAAFSNLTLWATESGVKATTASEKLNDIGFYIRGFYALDDVEKAPAHPNYNGEYKLNETTTYEKLYYGLKWPTAKCKRSAGSFVGWNDKPDGTGLWYSQTGTGNGSGSDPYNTKKPVLREIAGYDFNKPETGYEINFTLYAIWGERGVVNTNIAYEKPNQSTMDSYLAGPTSIVSETSGITSKTMGSGVWSTRVAVNTHGRFESTGVNMLEQVAKSKSLSKAGELVGTFQYHAALRYAAAQNTVPGYLTKKYYRNKVGTLTTRIPAADWNVDNASAGTVVIGDTTKEQAYHEKFRDVAAAVDFNAIYTIQGTYEIDYAAYARQYSEAQNALGRYGQGWGTGESNGAKAENKTGVNTVIKIDRTQPYIESYIATQHRLTDYKAEDIENAVTGITAGVDGDNVIDLTTTFNVKVSDYNNKINGDYVSKADSSGIYGVFVRVMDADNNSVAKVYRAGLLSRTATTDNADQHTLEGVYQLKVNLYKEFPQATNVVYYIYAVDYAGNRSELTTVSTLSRGQVQTGTPGYEIGIGSFPNFTIKTVIRNDEGEEYNAGEGETYFQVGDIGHLEVWTVGYVENIDLDFGDVGRESAKEILNGTNPSKFSLGILGTYDGISFARNVSWEKAEAIRPESLTYVENGTAKKVQITDAALYESVYNGDYYNQAMTQNYISHWTGSYDSQKWLSEGVSTRIPPYYPLVEEGSKKHPDGSPMYKWELWNYQVIGHKKNTAGVDLTIPATSTYFIWDTRANDVHYRVLHES